MHTILRIIVIEIKVEEFNHTLFSAVCRQKIKYQLKFFSKPDIKF